MTHREEGPPVSRVLKRGPTEAKEELWEQGSTNNLLNATENLAYMSSPIFVECRRAKILHLLPEHTHFTASATGGTLLLPIGSFTTQSDIQYMMYKFHRILSPSEYMRSEILTTVTMKITVFWDAMPCIFINILKETLS